MGNSSQVFLRVLEKPLAVFTYSLSAFLGISLGTVLSPSPWQSTLEAIHVHLCGHPPTGIQLAELQKLRIIPRHRNALLPPDNMVLDRFSGYKSEREQPALKDEMPLRRKGKENKRLLVQPKGTHHCHHRRSTSKASKAPEKVTLGGRRWGIAFRAQVSFCYLRTVPEGR